MLTRSRPILWVGVTAVLLGGLYFALKSSLGEHEQRGVHTRVYRLSIPGSPPPEEAPVFKVLQGDIVTLVIRSARAGELHVHGYEKKVVLQPGAEVSLTFTATQPGVFPVHLHDPDGSMRRLAMLEVQPR